MSRPRIPPEQRQQIIERARRRCEYCLCQMEYASQSFDIDHIIPVSRGGNSSLDNLAFACSGCNRKKHTRQTFIDTVSGEIVPLYHPRKHHWHEHFGWNQDFTILIGLTPVGRATIEAMELNRQGVVNLRSLLRTAGKHPPTSER